LAANPATTGQSGHWKKYRLDMKFLQLVAIIRQIIEFMQENGETIEQIRDFVLQIIELFNSFNSPGDAVTTLDASVESLKAELCECEDCDSMLSVLATTS